MNIHELVERTGVAERQVRYLIAEGFLAPPRGGRANAWAGAPLRAWATRLLPHSRRHPRPARLTRGFFNANFSRRSGRCRAMPMEDRGVNREVDQSIECLFV